MVRIITFVILVQVVVFGMGSTAFGETKNCNPKVIHVNDHVIGFYVGRGLSGPSGLENIEGNWVNGGAWDYGAVNYIVYRGNDAVVYDSSTLPQCGRWERNYLEGRLGITNFKVVLSHWHLDHIAGLPAFSDSRIYALKSTDTYLRKNRKAIEAGKLWGPPAIPVVLPTDTVEESLDLEVGKLGIEFRHYNIHSRDGFVMIVPADKALYAGDTLEDTVTFIVEPGDIPSHIDELARMRNLPIDHIYPNHGNPAVIGNGGYTKALIDAVVEYDGNMLQKTHDPGYLNMTIEDMIPNALAADTVSIWKKYRTAHRNNLQVMHDYWRGRSLPNQGKEDAALN